MSLFIYRAAPLETLLSMTFFRLFSLHLSLCYCIRLSSERPPQRKHVQHSHALGALSFALSFDIQIYANPAAVKIKCSGQTPVVMGANVIGQDTKWFRHSRGCDVLGCCFDPHCWAGECILFWIFFFFVQDEVTLLTLSPTQQKHIHRMLLGGL